MSKYPVKTDAGIIGAMAECLDCGWINEGYKNAQATAKIHAQSYGHHVHVETVMSIDYRGERK